MVNDEQYTDIAPNPGSNDNRYTDVAPNPTVAAQGIYAVSGAAQYDTTESSGRRRTVFGDDEQAYAGIGPCPTTDHRPATLFLNDTYETRNKFDDTGPDEDVKATYGIVDAATQQESDEEDV